MDRNESPLDQQSITAVENLVVPKLDRLIEKIRVGRLLTELEERFISAVHWYNKGRWQRDPADTYLFYWIGIETLFGGVTQEQLFEKTARLSVSWQGVYGYGWYGLRRHQEDLVKMIQGHPDVLSAINTELKLNGWDKTYKPLLDHRNVQKVIRLIPCSKSKLRAYAKSYLDYLLSFVNDRLHLEKELEVRRQQFRFKLYLLKNLRDEITHGGVQEHPTFMLFSDELQDVFERLLQSTGNAIINNPRKYTTVDALIKDVDIWWVR